MSSVYSLQITKPAYLFEKRKIQDFYIKQKFRASEISQCALWILTNLAYVLIAVGTVLFLKKIVTRINLDIFINGVQEGIKCPSYCY